MIFYLSLSAGLLGLTAQVLVLGYLISFSTRSSQIIGVTVGLFLLCLSLGAFICARFWKLERNKLILNIGHLFSALSLIGVSLTTNHQHLFVLNTPDDSLYFTAILVCSSIFALAMGVVFPAILNMYTNYRGPNVSYIYGADLTGAFIGALLAGYILQPVLGISSSALLLATIAVINLVVINRENKIAVLALLLFAGGLILQMSFDLRKNLITNTQERKIINKDRNIEGHIVFQTPSPFGLVKTIERNDERYLYIDGRLLCSSVGSGGAQSEEQFVDKASQLNSKSKDLLIIGLGCGFTAAKALNNQIYKTVDVVEINPEIQVASRHFEKWTQNLNSFQNYKLIIAEGFQYMNESSNKYDVIAIDVEDPSVFYSSHLYTREGYLSAKRRLNQNGTLALWAYEPNRDIARVIFQTLRQVFAHVTFQIGGGDGDIYFFASDDKNLKKSFTWGEKETDFFFSYLMAPPQEIETINDKRIMKYWGK